MTIQPIVERLRTDVLKLGRSNRQVLHTIALDVKEAADHIESLEREREVRDNAWLARIQELQSRITDLEAALAGERECVAELVIAARIVAFEDTGPEALRRLDIASEAFADMVPWEDQPK